MKEVLKLNVQAKFARSAGVVILCCVTSFSLVSAAANPNGSLVKSSSDLASIQNLTKTIENEVLKNRPAREKDENNPQPIEALAQKAYPATESMAASLGSSAQLDRNDALLIVRAVEDLLSIDPSASGAMILGELRSKPAVVSLMSECRPALASVKAPLKPAAIANQEALSSAGLELVNQKELCEFRGLMKDLDRLEKNGNG